MSKILVVGAGFSGVTIARLLSESGYKVHVVEKRDHVAGNAFDYINEFGIRVHKYGPHLFHTSNEDVFSWLSNFCEWVPYRHKVKAQVSSGEFLTLPVNAETKERVGVENVLDIFFRPYSEKMWGMSLEDLDPEIIRRVPIREDMNEEYFPNDAYQALPREGYTSLIYEMLKHPNISLTLSSDFSSHDPSNYDHIFNSMPIDEYFNYIHGPLPYRSIKFAHVNIPMVKVLPVVTVNFTHRSPFTRITEWRQLPNQKAGFSSDFTTLTFEEPCDYINNNYERYYPVKDLAGVNKDIFRKYKEMTPGWMTFIGRCGTYSYLDMHQAISMAMKITKNFLNR